MAAAALAVWLMLGAAVTGQAQTDASSASLTQAASPASGVLPPPMTARGAKLF
jgi:hypothetical protein